MPFQVLSATLAWTRAAPLFKREPRWEAFTKSRQISSKKNSSGKPKLGWPGINASARHRDWCPGRTGPQLRLPGHDLTAFDKTGLPAKTKFNSFRVALLYPPHPPSFSQPTTIGPPAGSQRPGLPHSTILVATEPRKAERLISKRCTPKLPPEF